MTAATVASEAATAAVSPPIDLSSVITTAIPSALTSALPSAITTTAPITSVAAQVPAGVEMAAAFAGALAGALVGVRLRFDLIGVATLAVVSGLGGGIIRDVLLQRYGIYALDHPELLLITLFGTLIAFFFYSAAARLTWAIFIVDALALGIFAVIGSDKALLAGLAIVPAILLGSITAVGGGVLRDLLTGEIPQVLRPGGFYASAAIAGCAVYIGLASWLNVVKPVSMLLAVVLVVVLRLATHWLGWQTPTATDLTPYVAVAPKRAVRTSSRAIDWAVSRVRPRRGGSEEDSRRPE